MQPCQTNSRSFFHKLQNADGLDLRDKRGQRHDLAVILVGVTLALLSHRDGSLSSIHRHLVQHYEKLMMALEIPKCRPVSRAQLPRVLEKVSVEVFDNLIFAHFGLTLSEKQRQWFAVDGKELRGSISKGEKRGEAMVQAVAHENQQTVAQGYYCGKKESEKPVVRHLLTDYELAGQKISLDALHCNQSTLELITQATGKYVVGLKNNQKHLLEQAMKHSERTSVLYQTTETEKGHGRLETRCYEVFDLLEMEKASRWKNCQIRTLIKVSRQRQDLGTGKISAETSYYMSNEVGNYEELIRAIRGHWQVEANNHLRDVTMREDALQSKKRISSEHWRALEVWRQTS